MVFLNAFNRSAALFARHWRRSCSHRSIFLSMDLHCHFRRDKALPFMSSPYNAKSSFLCTTAFDSTEASDTRIELECDGDSKIEDSSYVFSKWGCTESDISKIFERRPSLRNANTLLLESKLNILSQLGIKSKDLVRIVHCRPRFLNCKINTCLNERLEYLQEIFGSRDLLIKAIVRNPSLLTYDLHNKIKPTIALYESLGLSKRDLIGVLLSRPTLIPRTNLDDEKIKYIHKTGVLKESKMYKHVVSLFAISRMETILEKVMNLEKFGLSEDEIYRLIGRSPLLLTLSIDKVQRHMTYIVGTMKLPAQSVLKCPFLLFVNMEAVLKPRFVLACKIEDMGLEPQIKGQPLLTAMRMSDNRFVAVFITCHRKKVAEELMSAYNSAKCVRRLAESSKKINARGFPF